MTEKRSETLPLAPIIVLIGGLLIAGHLFVALISSSFVYARHPADSLTLEYILTAIAMGLAVPALVWLIPKVRASRKLIGCVFIVGLTLRGIMFSSTPVLEDDSYRYLWDGASVANGIDPYKYAPIDAAPFRALGGEIPNPEDQAERHVDYQALLTDALEASLFGEPPSEDEAVPEDLQRLRGMAQLYPLHHDRVAYPKIKTIYPPVAQAGFAFAHILSPFNLNGWRLVLMLVDILAFGLGILGLIAYGRSVLWVAIYWWNPVVTLEFFNAGHMDLLIMPFLFAALWLSKAGRNTLAAAAIAGAAAVKIWPALLMPALMRRAINWPLTLLGMGLTFGVTALILLGPQLLHLGDPDQGLAVYSSDWRRNAFLFSVLVEGPLSGFSNPGGIGRGLVAVLTVGITMVFAWRADEDDKVPLAMLGATAALLFLSPTGFIWYLSWLVPFLCFVPNYGIATLMATGPIYYTRFLLGDTDPVYQWGLVPLAFGLPLLIIAVGAVRTNWRPRHA